MEQTTIQNPKTSAQQIQLTGDSLGEADADVRICFGQQVTALYKASDVVRIEVRFDPRPQAFCLLGS
jgi:hypothetical protein